MMLRILANLVLAMLATGVLYSPAPAGNRPIDLRQFGNMLQELSEPEGYFDSDNFVSNEAAYLQVIPALRRLGVTGGAYIGVGPDQNYSYMAEIRPELAFIVDIRRQNSLQHLYYKALFHLSSNREEYIQRLFGRPLGNIERNGDSTVSQMLAWVDSAPRDPGFESRVCDEAMGLIQSWNLRIGAGDLNSIRYIARAFFEGGPDLKFTSHHRAPRPHHPTYRVLLEGTDSAGEQTNYLASESRFQIIRTLHDENRIIPLVGDLGGSGTMTRVSQELRRRGLEARCFYVSNVEFYLFRGERWHAYIRNLRALPWSRNGYIIRSYANMWEPHPARIPGHYMSTLLQSANQFIQNEASGRNATYWEMVTTDYIAR